MIKYVTVILACSLKSNVEKIQRQYDSDEEEDVEDEDPESDSDAAPELITSREDFDAMMNEFLDNYEVLGGKMLPVLPGETPVEKLDVIRKGLGEVKIRDQDEESEGEGDILMPLDVDEKADRWDCETILSTSISADIPIVLLSRLHCSYTYEPRESP